jgi:ribosomal-protein-alanine N-acetyltransferase
MSIPDLLATPRLLLAPPTAADAEAIFTAYAQSSEVVRYLRWRPHSSIGETREFLRECAAAMQGGRAHPRVIRLAATQELIGMIDLRLAGWKAELGYVLARPHWGQGYTGEAAAALIQAAWTNPKLFRIWATCDCDNIGSARVLEKLGMEREGRLKRWVRHPNLSAEPRDAWCYALTR